MLVAILFVSFIAANIASAMAFDPTVSVDGARIETDKKVYMVGETVNITVYIVNKLNRSIGECATNILLEVTGPLGNAYRAMRFHLCAGERFLRPGSEAYLMQDTWPAWAVPGTYTIEVFIGSVLPARGEPEIEEDFAGSTTIMVII